VDLLTGTGTHRVRTGWPLHPDLDARFNGATHLVGAAGVPVLAISTGATAAARPWAARGEETERLGWWSPAFESWTPAWLVGAVCEAAALPLALVTVLSRGAEATVPDVRLDAGRLEANWDEGTGPVTLRIDTGSPGAVNLDRPAAAGLDVPEGQ
jgi:hypothetical protein